jgi:hypothetical protein
VDVTELVPDWGQYDLHLYPGIRITCRRCTWAVLPYYRTAPLAGLVAVLTDHERTHQTVGRQENV